MIAHGENGSSYLVDDYLYSKVSGGNTEKKPTQEGENALLQFVKEYFSAEYEMYQGKVEWILDTKEEATKYNEEQGTCICGITKGYYDSEEGTKVQVYINPFILSQAHSVAYLTIGHEIIHAKHRSDGIRKMWNDKYGTDMGHNLSEYYAYEWQILTAQSLNYPYYGAIEMFNKYKEPVKDVIEK